MRERHGWARALDVQMDTLAWCITDYGEYFLQGFYESMLETHPGLRIPGLHADISGDARSMVKHTQEVLHRGDTIYITSDMLHLLMQAAHDLPPEAVVDDHVMICKYGFTLFEEPIEGIDKHGTPMIINALSWECNRIAPSEDNPDPGMAVVLYFWGDPLDYRNPLSDNLQNKIRSLGIPIPSINLNHFYPLRVGETLPSLDDVPEDLRAGRSLVLEVAKIWMAMQLLAQQRIGAPVRMAPDRATRKRIARKYGETDRLITLITLRRKSVKKDDEEPAKVEWSRRWVVRGHWRRQYYPKTKTHDWVYIYEHIKGPEDKPLVPTERRIFDFRR